MPHHRSDDCRQQVECFNFSDGSKVKLAELTNRLCDEMRAALAAQVDPEFLNAQTFASVIVVPPNAPEEKLDHQAFHRDSVSSYMVANMLIACDDRNFHLDVLRKDSVQRMFMRKGEAVLFNDHVHRGTASRAVRVHIRFELTRRGQLSEVSELLITAIVCCHSCNKSSAIYFFRINGFAPSRTSSLTMLKRPQTSCRLRRFEPMPMCSRWARGSRTTH